jgi:hypothetical protein
MLFLSLPMILAQIILGLAKITSTQFQHQTSGSYWLEEFVLEMLGQIRFVHQLVLEY